MIDFVLEFLPVVIVGAIIGAFAIAFLTVWFVLRKRLKSVDDQERKMSDKEIVVRLLRYAKPYWKSFVGVFFIMLFSIVYDIISPLLVGEIQRIIKDDFQLSQLFALVAVYAGILVQCSKRLQVIPGHKLGVLGVGYLVPVESQHEDAVLGGAGHGDPLLPVGEGAHDRNPLGMGSPDAEDHPLCPVLAHLGVGTQIGRL